MRLNQQQIPEAANNRPRRLLISITAPCAPPALGLVPPGRDPTRESPRPLQSVCSGFSVCRGREGRSGRRRRHLVPPGAAVVRGPRTVPTRGRCRPAEAGGRGAAGAAPHPPQGSAERGPGWGLSHAARGSRVSTKANERQKFGFFFNITKPMPFNPFVLKMS